MHGGPTPPAGVDADGEDAEEEEEAGHAEAHLIDGGVAHQGLAVLPCVQLLTHLVVERDLSQNHNQTSNRTPVMDEKCSCFFRAPGRRTGDWLRWISCLDRSKRREQAATTPPSLLPLFLPLFPTGC